MQHLLIRARYGVSLVLLLGLAPLLLANGDHGHMGWGWGWMWIWGPIMMVLFWGAIIALVVWAIRAATERGDRDVARGVGREHPLEIARTRYARGEITREEFEQLRRDLS